MLEHRPRPRLGLFFFAAADEHQERTHLLALDAARWADAHGLAFVSTPERHFHRFGGAFPNPAVTLASLAAVTTRVELRAGSVVTPLHHPARIVEDFSVIDCISGGRVGISFGSGWNANDFVLAPDAFEGRREQMAVDVEAIREAWRSGVWEGKNPDGEEVVLGLTPRPIQAELPTWLTASRSEGTFRAAGKVGANLLTHLENQEADDLSAKIDAYREERAAAGHPGPGTVTVMLHTYVAPTTDEARRIAGPALHAYLRSAIDLEALSVANGGKMSGGKDWSNVMSADRARDRLAQIGVDRYLDGRCLIGSVEDCRAVAEDLGARGVDELACLIDFVPDPDAVLAALEHLGEVYGEPSDQDLVAVPAGAAGLACGQ